MVDIYLFLVDNVIMMKTKAPNPFAPTQSYNGIGSTVGGNRIVSTQPLSQPFNNIGGLDRKRRLINYVAKNSICPGSGWGNTKEKNENHTINRGCANCICNSIGNKISC